MHSVKSLESPEIWYVTGSQQLSGEEALKKVAKDSRQIAEGFGRSKRIPLKTVFKPVLKAPEEIRQLCMEANSAKKMRRVEGNRTVQQMAGALYYAETFSKEFAVVSLPAAEQRSADIYPALADHPRNAKARRVVSRVFFLAGARSVPSKRVRQTTRRGIWRDAAPAAGRVAERNAPGDFPASVPRYS